MNIIANITPEGRRWSITDMTEYEAFSLLFANIDSMARRIEMPTNLVFAGLRHAALRGDPKPSMISRTVWHLLRTMEQHGRPTHPNDTDENKAADEFKEEQSNGQQTT